MNLSDLIVSWIRTFVPAVVGAAVTFLVSKGFNVDQAAFESLVFSLATGAYYLGVRLLEAKWPKLGVLLGVPKSPTY